MWRVAVIAFAAFAAVAAAEPEWKSLDLGDGRTLRYALVAPPPEVSPKPRPMLLAFPPGRQHDKMVGLSLDKYWEREARARGWVVVSPVAPEGTALQDCEPSVFARLLDEVAKTHPPENGLVHAAGASNGGLAAFKACTDAPGRFASLTVLPGAPGETFARLERLQTVPVTLYVGADDAETWRPQSERAAARLKELGVEHTLEILPGQGHVLDLPARVLFDGLDARRPGARAQRLVRQNAERAVAELLDTLHDAAAKAQEERYFACFAPDAVFLGTDATERWTLAEFKAFAHPYFEKGTAWTYTVRSRRVFLSPGGDAGWFEEVLDNAKLGECRGTGAVVKLPGGWGITQYNLTVPVPNKLMEKVAEMIRAEKK